MPLGLGRFPHQFETAKRIRVGVTLVCLCILQAFKILAHLDEIEVPEQLSETYIDHAGCYCHQWEHANKSVISKEHGEFVRCYQNIAGQDKHAKDGRDAMLIHE